LLLHPHKGIKTAQLDVLDETWMSFAFPYSWLTYLPTALASVPSPGGPHPDKMQAAPKIRATLETAHLMI